MTEHEATAKGKTILSESNHDAATGVDVGVGSCEDGGEENGVDDVREDLDTSAGSHNDERRGRSILSTAVEGGVVEGHVDTDKEDGSHEQAENTPECPADSFRDGLAGVGSLTSSDTNELGSLERETSGDENSPEADKLASGAFNAHRHRTGLDESWTYTEEQTCSDGAANGDELQMTRAHGSVKTSLASLDILLVGLWLLVVAHTRGLFVRRRRVKHF
ncbi:unnamed protein product [Fusarium graminearum]|nr:unnamed protein product [Fusarium graminearum]